jgi:hypothetical protein
MHRIYIEVDLYTVIRVLRSKKCGLFEYEGRAQGAVV